MKAREKRAKRQCRLRRRRAQIMLAAHVAHQIFKNFVVPALPPGERTVFGNRLFPTSEI